jgi:hypothetical protein
MSAANIIRGDASPFVHGESIARAPSTTATVAEIASRHSIRHVLIASYRAAVLAGVPLNEASRAGALLAEHVSARAALFAAGRGRAWSDVQVRTYLRLVLLEEERPVTSTKEAERP